MLATVAASALAQTIVTSPSNGEQVSSPFNLNMDASTCSSLPVTSVGYSLDNSSSTSAWAAQSIDGPVSSPNGWHTLHVKVWNDKGGVCVTDISVDVVASGATAVIPADAVKVSSIQTLGNWTAIHDGGTPGSSSGTISLVSTPSLTGTARLFANQFNNFGGERYSAQFDGVDMVFPLGPDLYLSWANCAVRTGSDAGKSTVYQCELKPNYRF